MTINIIYMKTCRIVESPTVCMMTLMRHFTLIWSRMFIYLYYVLILAQNCEQYIPRYYFSIMVYLIAPMIRKNWLISNENVSTFFICFKYSDNMKAYMMPASYYKFADKLYQMNKVNQDLYNGISKIRDD